MERDFKLIFIFLSLLIIACNPMVKARINSGQTIPMWDEKNGFVVYDVDEEAHLENYTNLGSIKVTDTGFSVNCDYYSVLNQLKRNALAKGGNFIQITKHKEPDLISSCHRLFAAVYHVKDLWKYEKEFAWSSTRELKPRDFKGDAENRPNSSRTITKVKIFTEEDSWRNQLLLNVKCFFDCENSYLIDAEIQPLEFRIQQYVFDLAEVTTRQIKKDLIELNVNYLRKFDKNYADVHNRRM